MVVPKLEKCSTQFRESISPEERLADYLRQVAIQMCLYGFTSIKNFYLNNNIIKTAYTYVFQLLFSKKLHVLT
jgi:hypothetical protein